MHQSGEVFQHKWAGQKELGAVLSEYFRVRLKSVKTVSCVDLSSWAEVCGYFTESSQTKLSDTHDTSDKTLSILYDKRQKKKKQLQL